MLLARVVIYSSLLLLIISNIILLSCLLEYPFSEENMRAAYLSGCNIGLHSTLTPESISRCEKLANEFKKTLVDVSDQMDKYE